MESKILLSIKEPDTTNSDIIGNIKFFPMIDLTQLECKCGASNVRFVSVKDGINFICKSCESFMFKIKNKIYADDMSSEELNEAFVSSFSLEDPDVLLAEPRVLIENIIAPDK